MTQICHFARPEPPPNLDQARHENFSFGTGYVGSVQGAVLADFGHNGICVDIDEAKLNGLREGEILILELKAIMKSA